MKQILKRLLCGFLVILMSVTILPIQALAWSYMSHTNSANILRMEMLSYGNNDQNLEISALANDEAYFDFSFAIPDEFYQAIKYYPEAFRAGALGPDFYPDMVVGQGWIHPYDQDAKIGSGDWLRLLVEAVNDMPQWSSERSEVLAFTLGYMLHYCGDMFGHDFVNTFSGGTFPNLTELDFASDDPELNNVLSHMAIEAQMDKFVNKTFMKNSGQITISAPTQFVTDTLFVDGNIASGVADIYHLFETEESEDSILGGIPIHLDVIVSFRNGVMAVADKFRDEIILAGISSYADQWALDIDRALYGLADTFDMIAHRLVTGEKNPAIKEETLHDWVLEGYPLKEILKDRLDIDELDKDNGTISIILEELSLWLEVYGWKALGIPDVFVDGLPEWMDYITLVFTWPMDVVLAAVKTALSAIFAEIIVAALGSDIEMMIGEFNELYKSRLENPYVQLDHEDNSYKPSEDNADELMEYLKLYVNEQIQLNGQTLSSLLLDSDGTGVLDQLVDSEFEAFYNTMVMFKLILMGPENFDRLLSEFGLTQSAYKTNTAELAATTIRLDVKTIDQQWSGTDDNVYAIVRLIQENGKLGATLATKLLDNSLNNDLECGDTNTFYIDLEDPIELDRFEIILKQEGTATAGGGWACESIAVTPMRAGVALTDPIGVSGNLYMDEGKSWNLQFQKALQLRLNPVINENTPVTHVAIRIKTGNGSYLDGTDYDVYASAVDINNEDFVQKILLDKYCYNDFENGDDDIYVVPLAQFEDGSETPVHPTLGSLGLILQHDSSYDWYVKNATVTPYYGNLALTEPIDCGEYEFTTSDDFMFITPMLEEYTVKAYSPLRLTYKTSLDDGMLAGMRSLDAGVQWQYLPVLWETNEGRQLFFKLFKGFSPEIEPVYEEIITTADTFELQLNFSGRWNGISEDRRNALAEYSKNYLGQNTYEKMPVVTGKATVTIRDSVTGQPYSPITVAVRNNVATIQKSSLDVGTYDIEVSYSGEGALNQYYSNTEVIFENALTVSKSGTRLITVKASANNSAYGTVTGRGKYEQNSGFTLTATPNHGYVFKEWLRDGVSISTENPYTGTARPLREGSHTYVAVFEHEPIKITARAASQDNLLNIGGTVEGAGSYQYGEEVTLTATPNKGYVFVGWYVSNLTQVSTDETYTFTAYQNRTFTAKFAPAVRVRVNKPSDTECGYSVFESSPDADALAELLNGGNISLADLRADMTDIVGKTFIIPLKSKFLFTVKINGGFEKGADFAVKANGKTLTPNRLGLYLITPEEITQITVEGVYKLETTPKPVLSYKETNGGITFTATGEGDVTLYVNQRAVEGTTYTLTKEEIENNDGIFSVFATAKVADKAISEWATLNDNIFGSDLVVPVVIENSENGTVAVDDKYDAPGTKAKLTVVPEDGYALDKLIIKTEDGTTIEYTDKDIVESEDGKTEIIQEEGVYYFNRPSEKATVRAVFKVDNTLLGDIDMNGAVDIADAIVLFRYSMMPDLYPIAYSGAVDFTKDGVIDIADAIRLFQYSMLPDLYPLF